jgi:hypothetical protein
MASLRCAGRAIRPISTPSSLPSPSSNAAALYEGLLRLRLSLRTGGEASGMRCHKARSGAGSNASPRISRRSSRSRGATPTKKARRGRRGSRRRDSERRSALPTGEQSARRERQEQRSSSPRRRGVSGERRDGPRTARTGRRTSISSI